MTTTKMYEMINWYRKEYVHNQYASIVDDFKDYEKISRKKMIEAIYELYNDYENIIDICTARELKYLKLLLNKKFEETPLDPKYEWEKKTLRNKFLIQTSPPDIVFIPDEIIDSVKKAVKKADYDLAETKDEINEILVGYCKIQGTTLLNAACSLTSQLTGYSTDTLFKHALFNRAFNYYVMLYPTQVGKLSSDFVGAVHRDFYGLEEQIDEARKKQNIVGVPTTDQKTYQTIFYNDFDIDNKKVNKMIKAIKALPCFWPKALYLIRECAVLNADRNYLKEALLTVPSLKNYNLTDLFKLLDEAMDEMPSGALNGLTPNEARKIKLKEQEYTSNKEKKHVKQTNAHLSEKDAKLFYKIYFALLEFTNQKYKMKPDIHINKDRGVNPYEISDIVETFWREKDSLIEEFITTNPYKFNREELEITGHFKKGLRKMFIIAKYEKEYTALIDEGKVYMIKGLYDNIDALISYKSLPQVVITAVIPFKNVLTYDGIFMQASIRFGPNFAEKVENGYTNYIKCYHL